MKFFFDRNIAEHLARMLAAYDRDNTIIHQDRDVRFKHDDTDVFIINTVASERPKSVFITADVSQLRKPPERKALADSGMTIVFFRSGFHDLSTHRQALKVIWIWPTICTECARCREPTVFEVSNKVNAEKIDRICATRDLLRQ